MVTNTASFDFSGARVVVTGGTSGIGHAIASAFQSAGATVMVTGTRDAAEGYGVDLSGLSYRQLCLDDPASVDGFLNSLGDQGAAVDVLVNNAGANLPGGLDEWSPEGFAQSVAINLVGPMRLTVGCEALLGLSDMPGGASVVNLASMAAYRAQDIVPGYGAAKAAVVNLTANLAQRWAGRPIRVNAVAPGVIDTPMTAPMALIPEILEAELGRIPMGRTGTPEDLTGTVMFLCSSASRYTTGHTVAVDGGYLAL